MRFQIFKKGKVADKFDLCGTYLFGTDGIAIRRSKIAFRKGFVECEKPYHETSGLALLWPVEGFGKVLLPTTCLPERKQPYNLNVELARAKLMQIINKREDWAVFGNIEGVKDISKEAQNLFISAIQNISDGPLAAKLADEALEKAIVFSEELATRHAETLFETKSKNRGFGRGCLCCKIDANQITKPQYLEKFLQLFGFGVIPVNWAEMEPEKGIYDFSKVDKCLQSVGRKKLAIGAGPLLYFSKDYLPQWLIESDADFEEIRDSAYRFVSEAVSRFSGRIRIWNVLSCLNYHNYFDFSFEEVLEMTRAINMAVKAADTKALKIIEVCNPWGEYYAQMPNSIPPLVYMDMVIQSGINFDAFGLQIHVGKDSTGMHVRDMLQISAMLDNFGAAGKPLYITEVEVPSQSGQLGDIEDGGIWHRRWDQLCQGQWIEQFYKIAFSKPFIDIVTYSNLTDNKSNLVASSGLLTKNYEAKKSFLALKKLHKRIFGR